MIAPPALHALRADLRPIAEAVPAGARVLDIGCGDGELMAWLEAHRQVDARGIELDPHNVASAMARGLSVVQGNADTDLADYPEGAFDVAVLSLTLQATRRPDEVLGHMLRLARRAVVSFPNFGHWRARWCVAVAGQMPKTKALPVEWYETTNIHLCTIADFEALCAAQNVVIEHASYLEGGRPVPGGRLLANLLAEVAVYSLRRG